MGRTLCIDFGTKKTGLAVTDPLGIIVTGLDTVETNALFDFLHEYCATENVEKIVVGDPFVDGVFSDVLKRELDKCVARLKKEFPGIPLDFQDEAWTSQRSKEILLKSGIKKKKRRDKTLVDKISAVLILQEYLGHLTSIPE